MKNTILLTDSERLELSQRAASRNGRADDARRARLLVAGGQPYLGRAEAKDTTLRYER